MQLVSWLFLLLTVNLWNIFSSIFVTEYLFQCLSRSHATNKNNVMISYLNKKLLLTVMVTLSVVVIAGGATRFVWPQIKMAMASPVCEARGSVLLEGLVMDINTHRRGARRRLSDCRRGDPDGERR